MENSKGVGNLFVFKYGMFVLNNINISKTLNKK